MDPSTLPTIKILVVDDHPSTAQTLARAISQIGPRVEVASATSGLQALEYTQNGSLDILITDMIMPEMTGLELIEQMQKRPAGKPTFSFLVTAYEVPGLQVSARAFKGQGHHQQARPSRAHLPDHLEVHPGDGQRPAYPLPRPPPTRPSPS